jgi:hypothetical protein
MYELMGLDAPPNSSSRRSSSSSSSSEGAPLVIDRTGRGDAGRYGGLKLGMVVDDAAQAEALADAERRARLGLRVGRPRLAEEDYERPFADLPPPQRGSKGGEGYWTAEKLDEYGKMRGRVLAEARREQADVIVPDRWEDAVGSLGAAQRLHSIVTAVLASAALGRSTPAFVEQILHSGPSDHLPLLDALRIPAAALLLASAGSAAYCASQAPEKRRNPVVWAVRGLLGGPASARQLRDLPPLLTGREMEEKRAEEEQLESDPRQRRGYP